MRDRAERAVRAARVLITTSRSLRLQSRNRLSPPARIATKFAPGTLGERKAKFDVIHKTANATLVARDYIALAKAIKEEHALIEKRPA